VSGGSNPTGTVTFNLYNNPNGTGTPLFTDTESLSGGSATSAGYSTAATGTDYWVATYNGDSNNNPVASGTASEPVTITALPTIATSQQPASTTVGSQVADKATVSGGNSPTGTVTFNLYNNPTASGTPLFTDSEPLSGGSATSAGYTSTATGTDYWVATYNGDSSNSPVSSGLATEPVTINAATPTISTSQQPAATTVGLTIKDKATVTGGYSPTGTVTFKLYANPNGTGTPLFTDANESLSGGSATSAGYKVAAAGTDYWVATYNGNTNNNPVSSGNAAAPVTVGKATPVLSWTTPAPITFGTPLGAGQLDATASVPGTFSYSPMAATVLQPGVQPLNATFTPADTADYVSGGTVSTTVTVGFPQSCITTTISGPFTIKKNQSICVGSGGQFTGPVTVQAGGALYVNGGTISGPLTATGAVAITLCAANVTANVTAPFTVTGTTGPVLVGGTTPACLGNTLSAPVNIKNNTGGVGFSNNTASTPVTITNNSGGFTNKNDKYTGPPPTISGNT
jgi:hypothetical protein